MEQEVPGNEWRGFKVAGGTPDAPTFDPTTGDRRVSPETVEEARRYLSFRFPAMKDAPLVESKVCQYESTPDDNFIVDQHPRASNVWIVGDGSGHGFKHGPAFGERVAATVVGERQKEALFSLFAIHDTLIRHAVYPRRVACCRIQACGGCCS